MPGFTTRPEIRGTFGVVASTHWIASAVGMSVLEKGGNAFDAAAAAGFTLQVVEPSTNGPLGEATMPLGEILAPAVGYAESGYPMVGRISETIAVVAEMFRREWPSSAAVYLPHGAPPQPGRLFRN